MKIMAKDLVRTRNHVKKFYLMRANIQAISLKLQVLEKLCIVEPEPLCNKGVPPPPNEATSPLVQVSRVELYSCTCVYRVIGRIE